ncbi:MAG: marine proteobacterial sortase target protein [Marinicellaceae bacterium]
MSEKITQTKNIRQKLENLNTNKPKNISKKFSYKQKYKGLGLNWRDVVILIFALFFVGLYQVQAHAQEHFDLSDIDTSMMLSYNKNDNNYGALTLLNSKYSINITGIIAEVNIKQIFKNNSNNWIEEGMYAFPVAENAAVDQMKLKIGQRILESEIHEKEAAKQIYESAKNQGLTASIVKQHRPNLFTTEVANIMPNEIVEVEINYQQTIRYDAGHFDFRLPLAIKNRYMQDRYLSYLDNNSLDDNVLPNSNAIDKGLRSININIEAGFDISEITSLNHKVIIQDNHVFQEVSLKDNVLYDKNDFVLRWHPTTGNKPEAAMFSEVIKGNEYVLLMLLPPKTNVDIEQKREVVFIIDTSGSMHGNAMNSAKDALYFGLTQLKTTDKFNIIEFNTQAQPLFEKSVISDYENINQAIDFIDNLKSDGGTNMAPALEQAMQNVGEKDFLKQIIFITDGSVGNEAQLFKQIDEHINNARLFTIAIGEAPNNYFMNKAALIGRGTYTNISKLSDVDTTMNQLFKKISSPALTNIFVDWNTPVEQNPRIIPDLYSDQPVIITAKLNKFNENPILSGFINKDTFSKSFNLYKDGRSSGIAKLWARNQIEDLTDDYMLMNDSEDLIKQQIIDIGLQYNLVSQFTSLVAVDKNPELSRLVAIQAKDIHQIKTLQQVAYPQTALGWKWQLLIGIMLIMAYLVTKTKYR